jgi:hypothetical protein
MKKTLSKAILLTLLLAGSVSAQVVIGGGGSGSGITSVSSLPATCTPGGTNAQVNLTVSSPSAPAGLYNCIAPNVFSGDPQFLVKYYGLAPQNYGAKGDTHVYFDCGMTTNNHVTCGSSHFAATDVGKWIESCATAGCAVGSTINSGTITVFNSATDVTTSMTAGTTYTNTRLGFGTDDDASMQSWASAMTQSPVLGVSPLVRGGYLPAGGYAIKQPLQIKYPGCGTQGSCTQGEAGANISNLATLRPSLWIAGQGTSSTFIYVRTAASFTWPTQTTNVAAFYVKDFDFSSLTNFAVLADLSAQVTTGITSPGVPGGIMNDNSTHAMWSGLWIQGFHNTTNTLCGFVNSANDFESSYSYSAFESNDFNACLGLNANGNVMEKIKFDTNFMENPLQQQNIRIGNSTGGLTLRQIRFINCHSFNAGVSSVNFLSPVITDTGEVVQFYGWRQTSAPASGALGIVVNTTTNLVVDFHGSEFIETGAGAGNLVLDNTSANATFNFYGGSITCTNCTNAFNNVGNVFVYGTKLNGPTVANVQTGAGNTYGLFPHAGANGGFDGGGYVQMAALKTITNCAQNTASPAACGSAPTGVFAVPTTTTTYTVNTTAVGANSRIMLQDITDNSGIPSAPTCTALAAFGDGQVASRVAGTSFTISLPSTAGVTCFNYWIIN